MENMENIENLAPETGAENVEQTTEETPKTFTQEDVNEIVGKAKARERNKIRKEYEKKYGGLEEVLRAGTGKESVEDMTDTFREFYKSKGVNIPDKPTYNNNDIEILARADADDIIRGGFEDVVEEVDRLAGIGAENMTAREKAVFKALAEHRQAAERGRELAQLGVAEDVYNGKEFTEFASKFAANTPIADVYAIYSKMQPKKDIKPMGSMKAAPAENSGVKDFYTYEEAVKFTKKDFDRNPELYKRVQESMTKW